MTNRGHFSAEMFCRPGLEFRRLQSAKCSKCCRVFEREAVYPWSRAGGRAASGGHWRAGAPAEPSLRPRGPCGPLRPHSPGGRGQGRPVLWPGIPRA